MALRHTKENAYDRDIHMNTASSKNTLFNSPDIHMATARSSLYGDFMMDTTKSDATVRKAGLGPWEREIADSPEVKRKATVAQLCEHRQLGLAILVKAN